MTCKRHDDPCCNTIANFSFPRLHTIPPFVGPHEKSTIFSMGCRTAFWTYNAACGGYQCRQIKIKMGKKEAFHDWRFNDRSCLSVNTRMDIRAYRPFHIGGGNGQLKPKFTRRIAEDIDREGFGP